jgi:hypothetical protein
VFVLGVAVGVNVNMTVVDVGLDPFRGAQRLADAPQCVGQAERDERPGGEISPPSFDSFDLCHCDPEDDAETAEDDGRRHVAETADRRDDEGSSRGPGARPSEDDEGKVMVGTEDRVEKRDTTRRDQYTQTEPGDLHVHPLHRSRIPEYCRTSFIRKRNS